MSTERIRDFDDNESADAGVYILLGEVNGSVACKIGMSSFVQSRVYEVCRQSPFEMSHVFILGANCRAHARDAERALHRMLKKYRTRGEWFMFDPLNGQHKAALHSCMNTVAALHNMPKSNMSVADLKRAVNFWLSEVRAARAEEDREAKKRGKNARLILREKRDAQKADRYARSVEFEREAARQRALLLARRTFAE